MRAEIIEHVQIGSLYYNLNSETLTAEVTFCSIDYDDGINAGWTIQEANIPSNVVYENLTYVVNGIGASAFDSCSELTSVTIPNSVTSIGPSAFYSCSGLTSITIPEGVTSIGNGAFQYCSGLTSVTIPNSVTSIGFNAFIGCSGLTSITIPEGVTSIDHRTFKDCSGLTSVTIPNSVTSIGNYAFQNCSGLTQVNISDLSAWCRIEFSSYESNPLSYAHHLYLNGTEITNLVIPDDVTSIGNYAFYNCSGLTSVTIGESVTSIGKSAFCDCSGLTSVTIPESVTSIGGSAFYNCSSLTSITIPNSVTSIGNFAFYNCYALTSVTIPESVTSIGNDAFANVPNIVYNGTADGSPWAARTINGYIDGYLVYSDDTKTTLTACFTSAQGDIVIPESVTIIGLAAFMNCSSLSKITLGKNIQTIENYAFSNCSNLREIHAQMENPLLIDASVFADCGDLSGINCYVPQNSLADYKEAAVWNEFNLLDATAIATGLDDIGTTDTPATVQKAIINGTLYVLTPDGTIFNTQGARVK